MKPKALIDKTAFAITSVVVFVVLTALRLCVAYFLAALCSSHVYLDYSLTDRSDGWVWFWMSLWLFLLYGRRVFNLI